MSWDRACPCGSGDDLDVCCGPLIRNTATAETPERLMRSRFTAYAVGGSDPALPGPAHLFRTWHPRTRPTDVHGDADLVWTRLEILDAPPPDTDADPAVGEVAFRAHFERDGAPGVLAERSRFVRRAGRWVYLDGDVDIDA